MASSEFVAALTAYVASGAHSVGTADQAFIAACADEAIALVDNLAGVTYTVEDPTVPVSTVPPTVLNRAYLEVGSELYNRRSAPNGISQFTSADGSAIRVARDPLVAARPILAPFLPLGFS